MKNPETSNKGLIELLRLKRQEHGREDAIITQGKRWSRELVRKKYSTDSSLLQAFMWLQCLPLTLPNQKPDSWDWLWRWLENRSGNGGKEDHQSTMWAETESWFRKVRAFTSLCLRSFHVLQRHILAHSSLLNWNDRLLVAIGDFGWGNGKKK